MKQTSTKFTDRIAAIVREMTDRWRNASEWGAAMKRIFLVSSILAISWGVVPGMAQCISTDRVWDIRMKYNDFNKEGIRIIPDGTFEANRKVYTRLSMAQYLSYSGSYNDNRIFEVNDGDRDLSFYLREENDVVYILAPNEWSGFEHSGDEYGTEFPVFDFNAKAGDSYMSVRASAFMAFRSKSGYKTLSPVEIHVRTVDNVEIGGRTLRRQFIDRITDPRTGDTISFSVDSMIQVIETIGIVTNGYPMAFVVNIEGYHTPATVHLSKCMNRERELLCGGNYLLPELTKERPVGKEAIVEYHSAVPDHTHLVWNMEGKEIEDGTVGMTFDYFRKWRRVGDNSVIIDPEVSSQNQTVYRLVNDRRKTSLRVTGSDGTDTDYPLYDFSKDRTEQFSSVMAEMEYVGDMPVLKSFTPVVCKIESVDFYDWNFKRDEVEFVKCQHVSEIYVPSTGETIRKNDGDTDLFSVVEGVGNVSFPLVYIRNGQNVDLNKARLSRGDIILLGENLTVPDPEHRPVRLIRENREWEYVTYHPFGLTTTFRRMKFDGTEEHYGRIYHRWVTFRTTVVNHNWVEQEEDQWVDQYTVDIDETERNVRLMREENSKVYMLAPDDLLSEWVWEEERCTWTSSDIDRENNEMILYDFNQRNGDIIQSCVEECVSAGFRIGNMDKINIEGEECIVQSGDGVSWDDDPRLGNYGVYNLFNNNKMVEGIGFDGWGTMTFIPIHVTTNDEPNFFINNVYNPDGEVVYPGENHAVPTKDYDSVEGIQADTLEIRMINDNIVTKGADKIRIYSLDGRPVHSASPNGEDYVISTKSWTKGTYIVKASGSSGSRTIKLQK